MELSTICSLDIYMAIYDPKKGKLVEFKSNEEFNINRIPDDVDIEKYDNGDYNELLNKFTRKEQVEKIQ